MARANPSRSLARQKQHQKQKVASVTQTQALSVVKNMVRLSISEICYLRNLFPDDTFVDKTYAGMKIKCLYPKTYDPTTGREKISNENALRLTEWIEEGVFAALQAKYLKAMCFDIYKLPRTRFRKSQNAKSNELVESYVYKVCYDENGTVSLSANLNTGITSEVPEESFNSPDGLKNQAITLIRSLISLTNTLQPLPADRMITMKLLYNESVPENWSPPLFTKSDQVESRFLNNKDPLKIAVGKLQTRYHSLSMKLCALEESLEDIGPMQKAPAGPTEIVKQSNKANAEKNKDTSKDIEMREPEADQGQSQTEESSTDEDVPTVATSCGNDLSNKLEKLQMKPENFIDESQSLQTKSILDMKATLWGYLRESKQVTRGRLSKRFPALTKQELDQALEGLIAENKVRKKGRSFVVLENSGAPNTVQGIPEFSSRDIAVKSKGVAKRSVLDVYGFTESMSQDVQAAAHASEAAEPIVQLQRLSKTRKLPLRELMV